MIEGMGRSSWLSPAQIALVLEVTPERVGQMPQGTIRGFSAATLIVEDEAARVPDDLYFSVRPMLAVSGGR
jgi:hypothetical protein